MEDVQMTAGSLSGLSVLDLGRMVAAPYCAKLLADLGADVIKVEEPGVGDPARRRGPFPDDVPHPERSGLFLYLNTSKRGITLRLDKEEGRQLFRQLVARVDVLIEDLPPGELERFGLGYSWLGQEVPGLVLTSITPFGQTGPHRDYRCHHLNLYHAGGQSLFWRSSEEEERPPPRAGGYLGEYDGGLTAAVGTMAAILARRVTGRGQHVDVSSQEAMMCLERVDIGRRANEPDPRLSRPMVGGLEKAKDGYFISTAFQDHQWQGLVRAMGEPAWTRSEWCQDEISRMENRDKIQPHLEQWAAGLTRDEIYHRAQSEGAPVGPLRNVAEVRAWEQAKARRFFRELDHPEAGNQVYPSAPYHFSETPWNGRPAPLLGEHNHEIYGQELGLPSERLARLAEEGVI
jgi:CoA:oxalate CoA-transferase